jgi:hypothetical protein
VPISRRPPTIGEGVKPHSSIQASSATRSTPTAVPPATRSAPAEPEADPLASNHALQAWILASILLVAFCLRILHLGSWSYWVDEAWTIIDARTLTLTSKSYPLFYALERATFDLLGISHTTARLVPALVGAASCVALFPWFRRFSGLPGAWVGLLMLAVSPWHIYWSQTARYYVVLLLFQTAALYFLYVGIVDDRPRRTVLAALLALTAFFIHFSAATFVGVAAAFLFYWTGRKRTVRQMRPRHLIPLVALLLVFGGFFLFWLIPRLQRNPWGDNPLELLAKLVFFLTPGVAALALVGLVLAWREDRNKAVFLALSAGVPFLFVVLLSPLKDANTRYLFATLPSYLALAAIPITALWRHLQGSRLLLVGAVVMALIAPSLQEDYVYFTSGHGNREPWHDALSFVRSRLGEGERVLAMNRALKFYMIGPERATRAQMARPKIEVRELEEGGPVWILVRRRVVVESLRQATGGKVGGKEPPANRIVDRWLPAHAALIREFPAEFGLKDRTVQIYYYRPPGKPPT